MKVPSATRPANTAPARTGAGAAATGRPTVFGKFSMNLAKTQSLNDGAFKDLPEGRFVFLIKDLKKEAVKSDPTGRKYRISLHVEQRLPNNEFAPFIHNFNVCSDTESAREIAFKGIKALCDACGVQSETFTENQFPAVRGLDVVFEVKASMKVDAVTKKPVRRLNLNRIDKPVEEDYSYLNDEAQQEEQEPAVEDGGEVVDEHVEGTVADDAVFEGEGESQPDAEDEPAGDADAEAEAETEAPAPAPVPSTRAAASKTVPATKTTAPAKTAPAAGKKKMPWEK